MTPPRRVLPNVTYLVTRRCSERRFFLRPSRVTSEIFLYVLAVAARRHGVLVHAFCVLSNHCHLVVTDRNGHLPAFMQYLDSLVARAVNASLGRFEGFWATDGSYSAVEPLDRTDVVAKTAYVLANPVAAGLVRPRRRVAGAVDLPRADWRRAAHCPPAEGLLRSEGLLAGETALELTAPPGFASVEEFRELLAESCASSRRSIGPS